MKLRREAVQFIENICDRYANERTPLMLVLSDIQKEYGYIPLEVQEVVSAKLNIPVSDIYGVVTFYSFFTMVPKGQYVINICLGTACFVRGADKILKEFEARLGIKNGETTADGKFTLSSLRCVGACGLAPVVQVNGKTYGNATIETVKEIIEEYSNMED